MGAVKVDTQSKDRAITTKYKALDSAEGVRILLSDYNALRLRRYTGDTAASDILIDLETAVERAGLTDRQRQALRLVYREDMTQTDAGDVLGIRKDVVNRHIKIAETKIARVYEFWARHSEGYSLTIETEVTA